MRTQFKRLLAASKMYTCKEVEEFMRRTGRISPTFLSKSVDRIFRDIKAGKYREVDLPDDDGRIVKWYVKNGEADNMAQKDIFDALHNICEALQKRAQRAKKEGKSLEEQANEFVEIIRNNIGKENEELFKENQEKLLEVLKKIDTFNNTPEKSAYYKVEVNSTWVEHSTLTWADSPDFKRRQQSETERILEEQQRQSAINAEKPTIQELFLAWQEYKSTINAQTETGKSEVKRKNLERLFMLIK